jgi:hypothetical protein
MGDPRPCPGSLGVVRRGSRGERMTRLVGALCFMLLAALCMSCAAGTDEGTETDRASSVHRSGLAWIWSTVDEKDNRDAVDAFVKYALSCSGLDLIWVYDAAAKRSTLGKLGRFDHAALYQWMREERSTTTADGKDLHTGSGGAVRQGSVLRVNLRAESSGSVYTRYGINTTQTDVELREHLAKTLVPWATASGQPTEIAPPRP